VKEAIPMTIAPVGPGVIYAVLLVDSGLVRFDFRGLVMVAGVTFMGAWGWYQGEKYRGTKTKDQGPMTT
jgi:hypothetical protein